MKGFFKKHVQGAKKGRRVRKDESKFNNNFDYGGDSYFN